MAAILTGTVGILGGSFDPPHFGHILLAHYALARWNLDRILVIPTYRHPFGKQSVPFEDRLAMSRLAFRFLGGYVEISEIEKELGETSYTIETVKALAARHPGVAFRLVVGGDIPAEASKWRDIDALLKLAPMLVAPRLIDGQVHGEEGRLDCPLPEISSTRIRELLSESEPSGAIPRDVLDYIREKGLYGVGKHPRSETDPGRF